MFFEVKLDKRQRLLERSLQVVARPAVPRAGDDFGAPGDAGDGHRFEHAIGLRVGDERVSGSLKHQDRGVAFAHVGEGRSALARKLRLP